MSTISLHQVRIASPCTASWDDMAGDDRSRYCTDCRLNVYNFAAMTQAEAETLIMEKEGRLCARIYQRRDGTVITRDCPIGMRMLRSAWWWTLGKAAAAVLILGTCAAWAVSFANPHRERSTLTTMQPFGTLARWMQAARPLPPLGGVICVPMQDVPLPPPHSPGE